VIFVITGWTTNFTDSRAPHNQKRDNVLHRENENIESFVDGQLSWKENPTND